MGFPNIRHDTVNVPVNHMGKEVFLADLRQLQGAYIQIILARIMLFHDLLPVGFQNCVHVMDAHIRNPVNEDFNIYQKALEILVQSQLRQQPVVELSTFQQFNHIITQMQIVQVCIWVIFCFRQPQQIVRGHAIEFCQSDDAEWADVLEIIGFVFSQSGFGNAGFFRKLLQSQVPLHPQILQFLLYCQFCVHKSCLQNSFLPLYHGCL